MTTHLDRLILIDQIKQRLLSISNDHFTHVTDTIFGLLNIPQTPSTEHIPSHQGDELKNIRVNKQFIKEIFTYLNTSYQYRKNSLSLKTLEPGITP